MSSSTSFKTIPDEAELAEVKRDLRFHPSQTVTPLTLTRPQVQQFNDQGFIKGLSVFDTIEITKIRTYVDELLAKVSAEGGNSYSISSAHLTHGPIYDLVNNPRIVAYVKDLLGENVIGWGSHFFCKMPHDGKAVAWHQDASYWPLSPSKTVTVWLAIDDADTENACMRFIQGSHWKGQLTYCLSSPEEHNVLSQSIDNAESYGEVINDQLKAGQISIHSDLLLHGSKPNESDRRRCGLTIRYCSSVVRAAQGWNAKGVVVSGKDTSGHWGNPGRP